MRHVAHCAIASPALLMLAAYTTANPLPSPSGLPIQGSITVKPIIIDHNARGTDREVPMVDRLLDWSENIFSTIGLQVLYDTDAAGQPIVTRTLNEDGSSNLGFDFKGDDGRWSEREFARFLSSSQAVPLEPLTIPLYVVHRLENTETRDLQGMTVDKSRMAYLNTLDSTIDASKFGIIIDSEGTAINDIFAHELGHLLLDGWTFKNPSDPAHALKTSELMAAGDRRIKPLLGDGRSFVKGGDFDQIHSATRVYSENDPDVHLSQPNAMMKSSLVTDKAQSSVYLDVPSDRTFLWGVPSYDTFGDWPYSGSNSFQSMAAPDEHSFYQNHTLDDYAPHVVVGDNYEFFFNTDFEHALSVRDYTSPSGYTTLEHSYSQLGSEAMSIEFSATQVDDGVDQLDVFIMSEAPLTFSGAPIESGQRVIFQFGPPEWINGRLISLVPNSYNHSVFVNDAYSAEESVTADSDRFNSFRLFETAILVTDVKGTYGLHLSYQFYVDRTISNGTFNFDNELASWTPYGSGTVALASVGEEGDQALSLTTGSPVGVRQDINSPLQPFEIQFDYQFASSAGTLEVLLDSIVLTTLLAPADVVDGFSLATIFVNDDGLLGAQHIPLEFRLTGATGTQVLIDNVTVIIPRPVLPGDANFDGVVDIFDVNIVSDSWGTSGAGDLNHDSIVDIFDINIISDNWTGSASAVPEPSTCILAIVVGSAFGAAISRRRR